MQIFFRFSLLGSFLFDFILINLYLLIFLLLNILSLIIVFIFNNSSGCFNVNSLIEKANITIKTQSVIAVAVAILLFVSQNNAISHKISSACTSQIITLSHCPSLEI
jgi:hypothetical protein